MMFNREIRISFWSLIFSIFIFSGNLWAGIGVKGIEFPPQMFADSPVKTLIVGYQSNSCEGIPQVIFSVEDNVIKFDVRSSFQKTTGNCLTSVRPFIKEIDLGFLESGLYDVQMTTNDKKEINVRKIHVNMSLNELLQKGEYFYWNTLSYDKDAIRLEGYRTSYCDQKIFIRWIDKGEGEYELHPIVTDSDSVCPRKMTPHQVEIKIPKAIKNDLKRILIQTNSGEKFIDWEKNGQDDLL